MQWPRLLKMPSFYPSELNTVVWNKISLSCFTIERQHNFKAGSDFAYEGQLSIFHNIGKELLKNKFNKKLFHPNSQLSIVNDSKTDLRSREKNLHCSL